MTLTAVLLLVEDESLIQLALIDALEEAGYALVIANDGTQALQELEADTNRFRGVITDIDLGDGPNGWAVGHRARELGPAIPIVYMSGHSAGEWTANGVPNSVMLQKPFAAAQLVTAISNLLIDFDKINASVPQSVDKP